METPFTMAAAVITLRSAQKIGGIVRAKGE
jgi:hypothetical protein